jgi:hypothetical protein
MILLSIIPHRDRDSLPRQKRMGCAWIRQKASCKDRVSAPGGMARARYATARVDSSTLGMPDHAPDPAPTRHQLPSSRPDHLHRPVLKLKEDNHPSSQVSVAVFSCKLRRLTKRMTRMEGDGRVVTADSRNSHAVSSTPFNLHANYGQGLEALRDLQHHGQSYYGRRNVFGYRGGQRQGPHPYPARVNFATESYNTAAGNDFVPDRDPSLQYLQNAPATGPVVGSRNIASMPRIIECA